MKGVFSISELLFAIAIVVSKFLIIHISFSDMRQYFWKGRSVQWTIWRFVRVSHVESMSSSILCKLTVDGTCMTR